MLSCLIGEIHIQLDESESWFGTDCVSSDRKVILDIPYRLVTPVRGLLNDGLSVLVVCLEEPFL
jgi:hypothetical protein